MITATDNADITTTDAAGKAIHDSRAERIKSDSAFITLLLPRMVNPRLARMVTSYCAAVEDSNDELVHLHEIKEAACAHFRGDKGARAALHITKKEWDAVGDLANDKNIRQGRHRGLQTRGMRDATLDELQKARGMARQIIEAFAAKLKS